MAGNVRKAAERIVNLVVHATAHAHPGVGMGRDMADGIANVINGIMGAKIIHRLALHALDDSPNEKSANENACEIAHK